MEKLSLNCYFNTDDSYRATDLGLDKSIGDFEIRKVNVIKSNISFYYEEDFYGVTCTMLTVAGINLCTIYTEQEFENLIK